MTFLEKLLGGEQAMNQFKNYLKQGDFEYIFDRQKLLRDVADPDGFVKREFQKIFIENSNDWFRAIEVGGELINKSGLIDLFGSDNISVIRRILNDIDSDFYKMIIKVQ